MLIRFAASNYLSIKDTAVLSFVASNGIKDHASELIEPSGIKQALLPAIIIFGPNAAGKTTILSALQSMRRHVLNSAQRKPGGSIGFNPFALAKPDPQGVTRFEIDFLVENVRHHYGFEFNSERYTNEWLYAFPEGYARQLFVREGQEFHFGKTMRGPNRVIESLTPANSLFLPKAAQNAHPYLTAVYEYFDRKISSVNCNVDVSASQRNIGCLLYTSDAADDM
jgi:hypothetical protein